MIIYIILFGICLLFLSRVLRASKELMKKLGGDTRIGGTNLDRFFIECMLAGCDDFSRPNNVQRAQLIADKYQLNYADGVEMLFKKGLEEHMKISQTVQKAVQEAELKDKREEENKELEQLTRYADLTGRDKRRAMLLDYIKERQDAAKAISRYATEIYENSQEAEADWAILGGFAQGIAGAGAGVATAIDTQIKNAQIREKNKKAREEVMPAVLMLADRESDEQNLGKKAERELQNLQTKLIFEETAEELIQKLAFDNVKITVSETGAVRVRTSVTLDSELTRAHETATVVDGTIYAELYDGKQLRGIAKLVLPMYGIEHKVTLTGICVEGCAPGKEPTVKFVPGNLWAMER